MIRLSGITSALVTPFDSDGKLDLAALAENVKHQLASGVASVCPLGGTGEPISMTGDEQRRVIDAVMTEAGGRARVIIGCLLPSQGEIVELGRYAKGAGADAIMVIAPYFVGAKPRHVRRHFEDIAAKVDMPMVLFNGPTRAGVKLEPDFVIELATNIPHLVAIKEATGEMYGIAKILQGAPARFAMLQGYDELILPTLALGGVGAVVSLGCLIPRILIRIQSAFDSGDLATARELQLKILPLSAVIYSEPNPGPLKYAMNSVGLTGGSTRPPLYPIANETIEALGRLLPDVMLEERRA